MHVNNNIKNSLKYIEENLKTDITSEELAEIAGYSVWHYYRLFTKATGFSVAAYIGKRRLDCALSEIIGGRRAVDVALDYGFDTYAGFYKAFKRTYGNSPKSYLKKEIKTMYTEQQLRTLLTNWDVPAGLPILDVYIMDSAVISGNVWTIGEDYILKVGHREELLKNIGVAKALARQGFDASTPVLTRSGAEYLEGEQIIAAKIAVLTRGIKGHPLPKEQRFGENRREFGFKYGESVARLHNVLAAVEAELAPEDWNLYPHVIERALPETKQLNKKHNLGLPDEFFEDYINNFGMLAGKLPKQLIHRDPNPANILFDGENVSGFIEFALSQRNARLFDPCYCATGILSEWRGVENIYDKWLPILDGILHGYDSVNPLTDEEKHAVFYVICSIQMIFTAYCEPQPELQELAQTNREMLQFVAENKARITDIF